MTMTTTTNDELKTAAQQLMDLQEGVDLLKWPELQEAEYDEFLWSRDLGKATEEEVEKSLLDAVHPVARKDGRPFGTICWRKFDQENPGWTEDDLRTSWHAGGGFYFLPTIQCADASTILFVAKSQIADLEKNPWISRIWDTTHNEWGYIAINHIDTLVVIPDEEIDG